jgi:hypothetical protein
MGKKPKRIQNGCLKKQHFSKSPILNIFLWKFNGLVLKFVELIDVKDIDVAQPKYMYGHEAVRHKFKNGQNSIALTKFLI